MTFDSLIFGLFLLASFFIYYIIPSKARWVFLLCLSIAFYGSYNLYYIPLLIGTSLITYGGGIFVEKNEGPKKKVYLVLSILIPILCLCFFKYFNFFSTNINEILRLWDNDSKPLILNIALPIGISFYSFQTVGYLIDIYRGDIKAERHLGKYLTFICFFPQITAGPIARGKDLLPQFSKELSFNYEDVTYGLKLMSWGYFKKLAIADNYSLYVNSIYDSMTSHTGLSLIMATVMYTIQIYCDFSGYSDIAIGIARIFGIKLNINFNSPYFATSIKEFWSKWHISLSTWFRDYLYIPLGGNRKGKFRTNLNLLITFLVSGLWHGSAWTFVIWGGVHGVGQITEKFLHLTKKSSNTIVNIVRWLFTFVFISFAWSFFRANTLSDIRHLYANCFVGLSSPISYIRAAYEDLSLTRYSLVYLSFPLLILGLFDWNNTKFDVIERISSLKLVPRWCIYVLLVLLILFLYPVGAGHQFIYFKF